MINKAGTILVNIENKMIGLVYREKYNDFSFPKGHIEKNETLLECALRETEEETGHVCIPIKETPIGVNEYIDALGQQVNVYMFLAKDIGETCKEIDVKDKEELVWVEFDDVDNKLTYDKLKDFWICIKERVYNELFE